MSTMPTSLTLKCTLWRTISINGAENQLGIIFLSSGFLAFVHRIRERSRKIWKARRIEEVDDGWSPAQRILMAMPRIHPKSSKVSSALDDDAVAKKSFFWQEKNSLYLCNSSSKRAWVRIIISPMHTVIFHFPTQKEIITEKDWSHTCQWIMHASSLFFVVARKGHKKREKLDAEHFLRRASSANPFWFATMSKY